MLCFVMMVGCIKSKNMGETVWVTTLKKYSIKFSSMFIFFPFSPTSSNFVLLLISILINWCFHLVLMAFNTRSEIVDD